MTAMCAACWHGERATRIARQYFDFDRHAWTQFDAPIAFRSAEQAAREEPHVESAPNCMIGAAVAQEAGIPDWPASHQHCRCLR